jgi:hypothetical protein
MVRRHKLNKSLLARQGGPRRDCDASGSRRHDRQVPGPTHGADASLRGMHFTVAPLEHVAPVLPVHAVYQHVRRACRQSAW